jgi:myo-inositol-1(or 4)-monophosphatase
LPGAEGAADLAAVLDLLAAATREAGALALQKFRSPFKSWTKGQNSPVSEVDIAVDALLHERLSGPFPDYGWLSEESADDAARLGKPFVWIVDPIDGTRAFIAGREDWVISAALAHEGRSVAGAIYVPVSDLLLLASAGHGATLNGAPLKAADGDDLAGARVAGPKRYQDTLQSHCPIVAAPRVHSLALRLAQVATAALDIAFAGGNSRDWDIAAADVIVHEAGGKLTEFDGASVVYNRADTAHGHLMAAGRKRHEALTGLIKSGVISLV